MWIRESAKSKLRTARPRQTTTHVRLVYDTNISSNSSQMKSKLSSPMKSQLSSQMKSQFSQHLPINPGLYHGFTLKIPRGIPPSPAPGDPQPPRASVAAPAAPPAPRPAPPFRRSRCGAGSLRARPATPWRSIDGAEGRSTGEGRCLVCLAGFLGLEWNIWNEFKDMNYKIIYDNIKILRMDGTGNKMRMIGEWGVSWMMLLFCLIRIRVWCI